MTNCLPVCLRVTSEALLDLHISPRAKKSGVGGLYGTRLKLSIAAPPVDNAANQELIKFLSSELDIPKREIAIAKGATSRQKTVVFQLQEAEKIKAWIEQALSRVSS